MFSNFSEGFSTEFTSIEDLFNLSSFSISSEPINGKEHEPESKPEKEVKTQLHKTQLFDDSSIKEFSNTLFEQVIKPELSTAMNSISYFLVQLYSSTYTFHFIFISFYFHIF